MPGGDGMGPMGMGPMTGRAAGFCAGYAVPGYMNVAPGRGGWGGGRGAGWGGGRGGGRGWRNRFFATGQPGWQRAAWGYPAYGGMPYAAPGTPAMPRENEIEMLKSQAGYFEEALAGIRQRLEELQSKASEG
ncbi:MAG TPA: DUF5320 domain-containing protein [Candidatus Hydrogenedentes bacterium]|nr:DUF5320 domain-containing protein [Candidatus Hydrogenedentota bacterium]